MACLLATLGGCASDCGQNKFECKNGRCVLASYTCDGDNDCGDLSDEQLCTDIGIGDIIRVTADFDTNYNGTAVYMCDDGRQGGCDTIVLYGTSNGLPVYSSCNGCDTTGWSCSSCTNSSQNMPATPFPPGEIVMMVQRRPTQLAVAVGAFPYQWATVSTHGRRSVRIRSFYEFRYMNVTFAGPVLERSVSFTPQQALQVNTSVDTAHASSNGSLTLGICSNSSCCVVVATGVDSTGLLGRTYVVNNTDNIGDFASTWSPIETRGESSSAGWRDCGSEVSVIVDTLDSYFGVSLRGDLSEDGLWVRCPIVQTNLGSLYVDTSTMGSVKISSASGEVRLGYSVLVGVPLSITVTAAEGGSLSDIIYAGLCGRTSCAAVRVADDNGVFYTDLTRNNNLASAKSHSVTLRNLTSPAKIVVLLHETRFLQVWFEDDISRRALLRLPPNLFNDNLVLRVICEGAYISARFADVQSSLTHMNPFLNAAPLPSDLKEFTDYVRLAKAHAKQAEQ